MGCSRVASRWDPSKWHRLGKNRHLVGFGVGFFWPDIVHAQQSTQYAPTIAAAVHLPFVQSWDFLAFACKVPLPQAKEESNPDVSLSRVTSRKLTAFSSTANIVSISLDFGNQLLVGASIKITLCKTVFLLAEGNIMHQTKSIRWAKIEKKAEIFAK